VGCVVAQPAISEQAMNPKILVEGIFVPAVVVV
jgi:hypothetical protein